MYISFRHKRISFCHCSHFTKIPFHQGWGSPTVPSDLVSTGARAALLVVSGAPHLTGSDKGHVPCLPCTQWPWLTGRHKDAPAAQDLHYLGTAAPFSLLLCELKWSQTQNTGCFLLQYCVPIKFSSQRQQYPNYIDVISIPKRPHF